MRVAAVNSLVAVVLGTMAGIALARRSGKWSRPFLILVFLILVAPEIVDAISYLIFFVRINLGWSFARLVIGHSIFNSAVVTLIVLARLQGLDESLEEAAADLGATPWRAFRQITLPLMLPAVLAGALLSFTFSLDDVIISSFVSTSGGTTLPVYVFSALRTGLRGDLAAISTVTLAATLVALGVMVFALRRSGESVEGSGRDHHRGRMKRTVFAGGTIITSDPNGRRTSAVAIEGDRIVAIGDDALRLADGSAEKIDLAGKTLVPGFRDGHCHPVLGGAEMGGAPIWGVADLDELLDIVRRYADENPDLDWIRGFGYLPAMLPNGRGDATILDQVVGDRPVWLTANDGHTGWVNSVALERAGIDATTPDPAHGEIVRRADGSPSGALLESAQGLIEAVAPPGHIRRRGGRGPQRPSSSSEQTGSRGPRTPWRHLRMSMCSSTWRVRTQPSPG